MKLFLLVVTILLLLSRIKNTPRQLSKTIYFEKLRKSLENNKSIKEEQGELNYEAIKGAAILITILLNIFFIIYYLLVGNKFSYDMKMFILSALQIITVFITFKKTFNGKLLSENIEDYDFYRFYFLFNVILDYIYYPLTIYMLMTK